MKRLAKLSVALGALLCTLNAAPALAQDPAADFQTNVQRAITTLNDMQALFTRMDQRKAAEAAGSTTPAPQPGQ